MRFFWTALLLLPAFPAFACVCVNVLDPCSEIRGEDAILVARVTQDGGDPIAWGNRPAKATILEVLKGLPKDLREVTLGNANHTDCFVNFQVGETYVIFGRNDKSDFATIHTSVCSPNFLLKGNERLLEALRRAGSSQRQHLVGSVAAMSHLSYPRRAPNVTVIAAGPTGERQQVADASGQFAFTDLSPGLYYLRVESPLYVQRPEAQTPNGIRLGTATCAHANLFVLGKASISGQVIDLSASPVAGVRVAAFVADSDSTRYVQVSQTTTDQAGRYRLAQLPAAPVIVAVNGDPDKDDSPYAPAFRDGASSIDLTQPIDLEAGAHREHVNIQVGAPRTPAKLLVTAAHINGTRVASISAWVEHPRTGRARSSASVSRADGPLAVSTFVGEHVRLRVTHFGPDGNSLESVNDIHVSEPVMPIHVVLRPKPIPSPQP